MKTRKNIIYVLFVFVNITPYLYSFYDFQKIHFGVDNIIGFYPIYGFLACMGLIIIAKTFSIISKKDDTYYD